MLRCAGFDRFLEDRERELRSKLALTASTALSTDAPSASVGMSSSSSSAPPQIAQSLSSAAGPVTANNAASSSLPPAPRTVRSLQDDEVDKSFAL